MPEDKKGIGMECMKYMLENLFWTLKVVWSKFDKEDHYLT